MKRKISIPFLFPGFFAGIGALLCLIDYNLCKESVIGSIFWVTQLLTVCLVAGLVGLEAELLLKRIKYKVIKRRNVALSLVLAILAGVVLGAGGQLVYALDIEDYEDVEIIDVPKDENANIVFLVDASGSMAPFMSVCCDAAEKLLMGLDENTSMQIMPFTYFVNPSDVSAMVSLNDAGKQNVSNSLRNIFLSPAGTDFDPAIVEAGNSLDVHKKNNCRSVIIMLSDCIPSDPAATLTDDARAVLSQNDIEFYIMRILFNGTDTGSAGSEMINMADEVFDMNAQQDGSLDVNDVLNAFSSSISGGDTMKITTKYRLTMTSDMLPGFGDSNILRVLLRTLIYIFYSIAAGFVYYGYNGIGLLLLNGVPGIIASAASLIHPAFGIVILVLMSLGGFTWYKVEEESKNV